MSKPTKRNQQSTQDLKSNLQLNLQEIWNSQDNASYSNNKQNGLIEDSVEQGLLNRREYNDFIEMGEIK